MVIRNTILYTLGNVANSAIPFVLLPVLTNYLDKTEYGTLSLIESAIALCLPIVLIGTTGLITANYYQYSNEDFRKFVSTIVFLPFISAVVIFVLFIALLNPLSDFFKVDAFWILLIPLIAFSKSIIQIVQSIFIVKEQVYHNITFLLLNTFLNVVLSLLFVIVFAYNWEGRLLGIIIANVVFGIVGIALLANNKYLLNGFYIRNFKEGLVFGAPLIIHASGSWIINMSNRYFLKELINYEAVGIFAVAYQLSSIYFILLDAFQKAWVPYLFKKLKDGSKSAKKSIVKSTYLVLLSLIGLVFILTIGIHLIIELLIDEKFHGAKSYILILIVGFAFNGIYRLWSYYIFYLKKTYLLTIISLITAIFNVILNYILIQKFNIIGAAYSTLISFMISATLTVFVVGRLYKMPWNIIRNG